MKRIRFFLSSIILLTLACSPEAPPVPDTSRLPMTLPYPGQNPSQGEPVENLSCLKGTVVKKLEGVSGDVATAVSVTEGVINKGIKWGGKENVFEILYVPKEYRDPGTTFYFSVRLVNGIEVPSVTHLYDGYGLRPLYGLKFSKEGCKW